MSKTILKGFDQPDEVREFPNGRFEIIHLAGVSLGRATYQPGWKWSVHNAPSVGTPLCHAPTRVLCCRGMVLLSMRVESGLTSCRAKRFTSHLPRMTAGSRVPSRTCRCTC